MTHLRIVFSRNFIQGLSRFPLTENRAFLLILQVPRVSHPGIRVARVACLLWAGP